jgi:hypothetical protein
MPFTLRQLTPSDNFCQQLSLDAFQQVIPSGQIEAALAAFGPVKTRNRRLTLRAVVWLVIAMHLFSDASFAHVFGRLVRGLRFLWPDPCYQLRRSMPLYAIVGISCEQNRLSRSSMLFVNP